MRRVRNFHFWRKMIQFLAILVYLCMYQSIACDQTGTESVRSALHNQLEFLESASYRLLGKPKQLKSIWSDLKHRLAINLHRNPLERSLSESKAKQAWMNQVLKTTSKWYKFQWQPYFKSLTLNQKRIWARYLQRQVKYIQRHVKARSILRHIMTRYHSWTVN